jgi:tRNA A-37 threonylcarbamoyl transferase component Bud32
MLQITTPKPLAYIEQRKGLLVWKSYLVTEYVAGQKLRNFLRDNNITEEKHSKVNQQVMKLLDKLGKYRITHGDLKHSNILVTDNGIVLTDLDGMKVHRWNWLYKTKRAKDIARFQKQADGLGKRTNTLS